jgi:NitT/TauT family transport system substrate-binding protein
MLGAAVAGVPLLAACNDAARHANEGGSGKTAAADTTAVSLQLGWLLDNGQLGEAVAIGKGWYADNGLDLTIAAGGPNIDGLALVAGGQHQIGQISSSPSLMLASSQGIPTKAFGVGVQEHPYAYFSKPDKAVREPQDLVGKTVGTQATGQILLSALLAANDIDPGDVEVVIVGSDVTPLTTGQVDVWTGWVSNVAALRPLGQDYEVMRLWDAGIQLYANPYYTTASTLADNKDMLAKFLAATGKGWEYANENREEAVDFLVQQVPTLNKEDMLAQAEVLLEFEFTDTTKTDGWGTMNAEVWQRQLDMWEQLDQFKGNTPSVDDVATFEILEATADARPKVG